VKAIKKVNGSEVKGSELQILMAKSSEING
jgi:hypothetical protein